MEILTAGTGTGRIPRRKEAPGTAEITAEAMAGRRKGAALTALPRSTASKSSGAFTYGGVGSGTSKPKANGGKDLSAFKTGVQVEHPKFGLGTIVNVRGAGANMILDIAFAGLGIKQLSASLAPLTIKK